ncbi:hypothetical protein PIB30_057413 [Stylosanthes scabra]|uniref:Uncharacterized protein n=1 Tax=Stylosanthes scabra TaxID=79078 RepID=A0ABU6ZIC1_9FABA|nr:hypothetical protein [Stylosanthes scabra]
MVCGFRDFCNRPIIPLPPEFPEACLRRLGGLKGLFFTFSHFCYSSLSFEFSLSKISLFRWCSSPLVERIFAFGFLQLQSSVLASEHLPELRREMRLAQDLASERDYVLEAAGPSDRLPFRALEDRTHFLWVYVELFTRLGVLAASQLHLNGWGFLRTFERVCLHFGFRPSWSIFLYTYQLHAPPPENGFLSFRAYQGRRLFNAFEESIQEFKWHYFKVLPLPGTRPFWVDDEGKPYPWVYWNSEARECRVMALDPLETLAFDFLQSLPVGLGKRSNFWCRWILDHSNAEVGVFLDSLLADMEKQSRFDRLKQKMAEVAGVGPRSVLPHVRAPPTTFGASASGQAVPAPAATAPAASSPLPAAIKKGGSFNDPAGKHFPVQGEEGAKEDPSADLKKKGRKRKAPGAFAEEAALGEDSSWVHKVSPINRAFPDEYNFREALDAGLTNGPTREILGPLVPEQLLGTAQHFACQLTALLWIGIEKAFASKVQMEKELASLKDQVDVVTAERDSALAAPLFNAEIKSLTQQLRFSEDERLSALARMTEVEERANMQAAELKSCRAALLKEKRGAEGLTKSLREKQTALDGAEAAASHWRDEWKSLAEETGDMVQETFEILMDQVRHLHSAIDFSMISLDTRWDPKPERIYNTKAEAQEQSEPVAEEQSGSGAGVPVGGGTPRRLFRRLK